MFWANGAASNWELGTRLCIAPSEGLSGMEGQLRLQALTDSCLTSPLICWWPSPEERCVLGMTLGRVE